MKLRNISLKKSKLIKLQLIKFKVYKQQQNPRKTRFIENENFEYVELHFKKMLQVIYNYHFHNKKILFIGLPIDVQKSYVKLFQQTNHLFIPESTWIKGILSNKISTFKYLHQQVNSNDKSGNSNLKSLFTIQQKPDLMVLFNKEAEIEAFSEAVKLRIPVIAVTINNLNSNTNVLYHIYGNFQLFNRKLNNIYCSLLSSIFKKISK